MTLNQLITYATAQGISFDSDIKVLNLNADGRPWIDPLEQVGKNADQMVLLPYDYAYEPLTHRKFSITDTSNGVMSI